MSGKTAKSAPKSKSTSRSPAVLLVVAAVAAVVVAVVLARRGGSTGSGGDSILFTNRLKDERYPNVTSRIQILGRGRQLGGSFPVLTLFCFPSPPDHGVTRPRPIDGPIPFSISGPVPVEDFAGRKDNIAEFCIKQSRPMILRNTVVTRWPALAKWTPEYFRTSVKSWENVTRARRLKRCFINFEPNTPFEKVTPWDFWENEESRQEYPMGIADWFERASKTDDGEQWFLADQLPDELHSDVAPRHQLKLRDQTWVYFGVWMGEGGATTAAHWDMDSNLYAQFYGRKRFLLFPPSDYKLWKSYPRASPNHKQVQMEQNNTSRYSYRMVPGAKLPVAQEAILHPGDLLFIPAYWYHHVEAMISPAGTSHGGKTTETEYLSISSNFWSTASMEFLIANSNPRPFGKDFPEATNAALRAVFAADYPTEHITAVSRMAFLSAIADATFGARGGLGSIARQICFLRYVDLFGAAEVTTADCPPPVDASTQVDLAQAMSKNVAEAVRGLKSINPAAAETEFMNMVEMHMSDAVPTHRLYPFLYNCFHRTLLLDSPPIAKVFPN